MIARLGRGFDTVVNRSVVGGYRGIALRRKPPGWLPDLPGWPSDLPGGAMAGAAAAAGVAP